MPLIDKKISELDPASALELLMTSELAIAPLGHPQTLRVSLELIQNLIGGEKTFMAATDPLLEIGRDKDNWLNTAVGSFWKKDVTNWVKKYQFTPGTGGGSNVDQSFETILYAASRTVAYNPLRPKKKITLNGNINITNTGTVNGSQGIYLLGQNVNGNHLVTINGTDVVINPTPSSQTVVAWMYDGAKYHYSTNYIPVNEAYNPTTSGISWVVPPKIQVTDNDIYVDNPADNKPIADWKGTPTLEYQIGLIFENVALPNGDLMRSDAVFGLENGTFQLVQGVEGSSFASPATPANRILAAIINWDSEGAIIIEPEQLIFQENTMGGRWPGQGSGPMQPVRPGSGMVMSNDGYLNMGYRVGNGIGLHGAVVMPKNSTYGNEDFEGEGYIVIDIPFSEPFFHIDLTLFIADTRLVVNRPSLLEDKFTLTEMIIGGFVGPDGNWGSPRALIMTGDLDRDLPIHFIKDTDGWKLAIGNADTYWGNVNIMVDIARFGLTGSSLEIARQNWTAEILPTLPGDVQITKSDNLVWGRLRPGEATDPGTGGGSGYQGDRLNYNNTQNYILTFDIVRWVKANIIRVSTGEYFSLVTGEINFTPGTKNITIVPEMVTGDILTIDYYSNGEPDTEEPEPELTTPAAPTFTAFNDTDNTVVLEPKNGIALSNYRYTLPGDATIRTVPNTGIIPVGNIAGVVTAWSIAHDTFNQSPNGTSTAFTVVAGGQLNPITQFTANRVSNSQANLSWAAPDNAPAGTIYTVERANNQEFSENLTPIYTGTNLTAPDNGLQIGQSYFYRNYATATGMTQTDYAYVAALIILFNDFFDSGSMAGYKTGYYDASAFNNAFLPTFADGDLALSPNPSNNGFGALMTEGVYSLRNAEITTEVTQPLPTATGEQRFEFGYDPGHHIYFTVQAGTVYCVIETSSLGQVIKAQFAFNIETNRFWKIRNQQDLNEASPTYGQYLYYWDVSGDGFVWENKASIPEPADLPATSKFIVLMGGTYGNSTDPAPGTGKYGHVSGFKY